MACLSPRDLRHPQLLPALLLARLWEERRLASRDDVTLRRLASHTSDDSRGRVAVAWHGTCVARDLLWTGITWEALLKEHVLVVAPRHAIRRRHHMEDIVFCCHSSIAATSLLARVLAERVAGSKYEAWPEQNVLRPMWMRDADFSPHAHVDAGEWPERRGATRTGGSLRSAAWAGLPVRLLRYLGYYAYSNVTFYHITTAPEQDMMEKGRRSFKEQTQTRQHRLKKRRHLSQGHPIPLEQQDQQIVNFHHPDSDESSSNSSSQKSEWSVVDVQQIISAAVLE
ncbi:unnamed protein product [Lampetra planeri]